jgi:hypothetical protein
MSTEASFIDVNYNDPGAGDDAPPAVEIGPDVNYHFGPRLPAGVPHRACPTCINDPQAPCKRCDGLRYVPADTVTDDEYGVYA